MGYEQEKEEQLLLKIEVEDSGIGIRQEDMDKLFLNFTRVDEQRNRNIQGTGLGLSLTKNLVELMGGEISVSSEYGKGSIFTAIIPQNTISTEPIGDFSQKYQDYIRAAEKKQDVLFVPKANILVVDDVEMNRKVAQSYIRQTGAKVDLAGSGAECLRMIRSRKYDIIFLDHMMPEMDGVETLREMKQRTDHFNTETPVIALTANAIVGAKEKYLTDGFYDYLSKPIREDELMELLRKYLPEELVEMKDSADPLRNAVEAEDKQTTVFAENVQSTLFAGTKEMSADVGETPDVREKETIEERFPYLNTSAGMTYCMNDEAFYLEMIESYIQEDKRELLESEFASSSWETYQVYMHALKSTSLTIGADELSEQAKALELAVKTGDYPFVQENHVKVMEAYGKLLKQLSMDIKMFQMMSES